MFLFDLPKTMNVAIREKVEIDNIIPILLLFCCSTNGIVLEPIHTCDHGRCIKRCVYNFIISCVKNIDHFI